MRWGVAEEHERKEKRLRKGKSMARFVIAGSKGTDDPTMATLPVIPSQAAHEQGHDVVLWLQAEAVVLAKKGVVDGVQGVGLPTLKVLANTILSQGIPLWEC
jgi:predicted peroxiredoxin